MSKLLALPLVLRFLSEHLAKAAADDRRMVAATLTHLTEFPHKHEKVSAMMEIMLRPLPDVQKKPQSATVHAISSAGKKIANGAAA